MLEPGGPLRRELSGGQEHAYRIALGAGQFLKVTVEQRSLDVVAQVAGPDGQPGVQSWEFDSESRLREREEIWLVAETGGDYRLTVRPKLPRAAAGEYEIRIAEVRAATGNDRDLWEARRLYTEGLRLGRAGKPGEAFPLIQRALEIRERILGPDDRETAAAINAQGLLARDQGEYAKAEEFYERALAIRERSLGPDHPDVATSLNNLGLLCKFQGDFARAEQLLKRSQAIGEKVLDPQHPDLAFPITNLAILYSDRGLYAKAEPLFERALAILEGALGQNHASFAAALNAQAILYSRKGDDGRAEQLFEQVLAIRERVLGHDHPEVAAALNNVAQVNSSLGDFAKAERLLEEALAIKERMQGPEHPSLISTLGNLASLFQGRGEDDQAEKLFQRALAIGEKRLGPQNSLNATSLNALAAIYSDRGDYAKGEEFYERARAIWAATLGPDHPNVAYALINLGTLYIRKGDYAKAEEFHQQALAIFEAKLGPQHPEVGKAFNYLAAVSAAKGDPARALAFQARANAVAERHLALILTTRSERQKQAYLDVQAEQYDQSISLHTEYAPDDQAARRLAATMILQRKGRSLDAASETINALRGRSDPEGRALLDQLADARSQLAKFVLDGPGRLTAEQYREQIRTAENEAEQLESEINRKSGEFRAQSLPITLEAIQEAIPADAALIEFALYRPFNARATRAADRFGPFHYAAYVIRHRGEIGWRELGEAKAIDDAIETLRGALRNPKRQDVTRLARAMDQRVFRPIRSLLGGTTNLLISPDGSLNLIPFAALIDERGRYLAERYSISHLASGRDLLRLQVARKSQSPPLVVADPDFGGSLQLARNRRLRQRPGSPTASPGPPAPPAAQKERPAEPAAQSDNVFSQFYFPALPYTAEEGRVLRELLPGSVLLTKREASKSAILQVRSPALLHIATHGFFLEDLRLPSTADNSSRRLQQVANRNLRIESPLLRSGLAMAGANEPHKDDNGILTALEVTGLNLWGTKLVVLSACDTGVGEVKTGDGVHGLRRALVLAGAETQVMSLWPVSDRWTRVLMVDYYRRLQQGQGRGEALRSVQIRMLRDLKHRHPYYWASFIQSGEWANLAGDR